MTWSGGTLAVKYCMQTGCEAKYRQSCVDRDNLPGGVGWFLDLFLL